MIINISNYARSINGIQHSHFTNIPTHFLYVINSIPTIVFINIIIHMANQNINLPTIQLQYYLIPTFPTNILTKTTNQLISEATMIIISFNCTYLIKVMLPYANISNSKTISAKFLTIIHLKTYIYQPNLLLITLFHQLSRSQQLATTLNITYLAVI